MTPKRTKSAVPKSVAADRALNVIRLPPLQISLPELPKRASAKTKKARRVKPKKAQEDPVKASSRKSRRST